MHFHFKQIVRDSFAAAAAEPKLSSREQLVLRNAAPIVSIPFASGAKPAGGRAGDVSRARV